MGFYDDRVLPYLLSRAMRQEDLDVYRRRLVREARGRVLEVGVGSGLNLSLYPKDVTSVVGVDTSARLLSMAARARRRASLSVSFVRGRAEALPLTAGSIDTVVTAWTMCSVGDVEAAMCEVRRVLKPSGCWLFVEHGRAPDPGVRRWQQRLTPLWRQIAGGCHLDRAMPSLLASAGFRVQRVDAAHVRGPRILTFMYEGMATPGHG